MCKACHEQAQRLLRDKAPDGIKIGSYNIPNKRHEVREVLAYELPCRASASPWASGCWSSSICGRAAWSLPSGAALPLDDGYYLIPRGRQPSPALRQFREWLLEEAEKTAS